MKFSREQLELYVKTLKVMKTERYSVSTGICYNLLIMSEEDIAGDYLPQPSYEFIIEYSVGWKHHTGYFCYPVPTSGEPLWVGKQLKYRLSLIDYIINKVEKELET